MMITTTMTTTNYFHTLNKGSIRRNRIFALPLEGWRRVRDNHREPLVCDTRKQQHDIAFDNWNDSRHNEHTLPLGFHQNLVHIA